jgi:predicted O-linked N-acetylglucosamine transferase (SPINDLY family)
LQEILSKGNCAEVQERAALLTMLAPQDPAGWKLLGDALRRAGRSTEAVAPLMTAKQMSPRDAPTLVSLAMALEDAGRIRDAEAHFRAALEVRPGDATILNDLGVLLQRSRRYAEAEERLREALRLHPEFCGALNNLGLLLHDTGRLAESESCFREALRIEPGFAGAYTNLGRVCQSLGNLVEAQASFRRALQLQPDFLEAQSSLLFSLAYQAQVSPMEGLAEARHYGRSARALAQKRYTSWLAAAAPKELRVGLISGDLRQHPVGYFLEALLGQLDRSRLEVFAFPAHHHSDALTTRLRSHCAGWTPLYGHDDVTAAQLIHADGVHVLIDLSGHTAHNRLPVFAYKPAPVQVTWLGYFATTGVAEIDYLLADPVSVPTAHQGHFSEKVWYLPDTRLCFTPPQDAPAVAPLPALANGFVTFGSFQNLVKLNDAVLALWARVLSALPGARLRLQSQQLADERARRQFALRLQHAGIAVERVSMHGPLSRERYLAAHGEVDLILDTFPFPGGTTTCEALWMGVPTLTLAGDRLIGRQGASLLSAAGLNEWVAETPGEFVNKALDFCRDLPRLAALRAGLRAQLPASPLFDAPRFARNFENALWAMWQQSGPNAALAR